MNDMRRSDWTKNVPSAAERLFYTFLLLLSSLSKTLLTLFPSRKNVIGECVFTVTQNEGGRSNRA